MVCYFSLGELGLLLAIPPGYASAIFPASAVAVVAVLKIGTRALSGVWLGSFAINLGISWQLGSLSPQDYSIAASIALGACMQAWLAGYLVHWRIKDAWQRLDQDSDIIGFLLFAGPVACLFASSWAALTLLVNGVISANELSFTWWNWWAGDTLGVLLFAPILLNLIFRREQPWRSRLSSVVTPTLVLTAIIVVVYIFVSDKDSKLIKYRFENYGQSLSYLIDQKLQAYHETVGSLASLMTISPQLTQADFATFTRPIFSEHNDINALSWNPVVTPKQRAAFEARFGRENAVADFRIVERDTSQRLVTAKPRDWYVAVGYIAPLASNYKALGYDIASNPDRLSTISEAMRTRQMTATPPVRLIQDSGEHAGLLLLQPVYGRQAAANDMPLGFAVGVFKIEEMLIQQTDKYLPAHLGFSLEDLAAEASNRLIYRNREPLAVGQQFISWKRTLNFAGRAWQISLYPTTEFLTNERSLFAWSVLATGLIVASMLQAMLLGISGRALAIQRRVDQQTQEIVHQAAVLQDNQQHLQREKEKYQILMHASGDGIHILDLEGHVVEANQKFCDLLGYQHHEIIGMHLSKWEAFFDPEQMAAKFKQNFDAENVFETRHRCKDGKVIDVEVSAKAIEIDNQWLLWNSSRDIGERKRLQQALTLAKETAEHAAELKSRFLANMSHEIRTPMSGIIGLTQLSLEQNMHPELRDYLEKILLSAQTLLGILNDILDLSKIEAGRMIVERAPFDLRVVLTAVHNLFGARASENGLQFEIVIADDVPHRLVGDALRLQQILINLISNAIKFTPQGFVRVSATALSYKAGQAKIGFKVTDSGIGIESQMLEKLFKPFSQLDDSISRRFGGTGLGLNISRDLLKLMGGNIDVVSQPGLGSCFSFFLWFDIDSSVADNIISKAETKQVGQLNTVFKDNNRPLAGMRILVAEDNAINQLVIGKFLTMMGIEFALAANGEKALDALETGAFDAVLMDVGMPVMDGREATRRIRAIEKWRDLPIIALSAGITEQERNQCLSCGMNDFIGKPIDPVVFVETLRKYL